MKSYSSPSPSVAYRDTTGKLDWDENEDGEDVQIEIPYRKAFEYWLLQRLNSTPKTPPNETLRETLRALLKNTRSQIQVHVSEVLGSTKPPAEVIALHPVVEIAA